MNFHSTGDKKKSTNNQNLSEFYLHCLIEKTKVIAVYVHSQSFLTYNA